jgi:hypothetical protein
VRVQVEIHRPRWVPRLSSGRAKVLATVAVLGIVAAPVAALGTDRFPDVPFGSGHEEVNKIADAGIVRGCGSAGTSYCPQNPVTRLQMAQFLSRAGGSAGATKSGLPGELLGTSLAPTAPLQLDVNVNLDGIPGETQFVAVHAGVTARAPITTGCPCTATFFLQDETGTKVSADHVVTFADPSDSGTGDPDNVAVSLDYVFSAPTDTEQTYFLSGYVSGGSEPLRAYGDMTATTYPFSN